MWWKEKTLDEIWRKKTMQQRKINNEGVRVFPGKPMYFIYK
jgi:hypothetical protein